MGTGVVDRTIEDRAVSGLLACVARHGWTKTTFDDIAQQTGCSRATLYRHFSGKGALLGAALVSERARFTDQLVVAADASETVEDALVAVIVRGAELLRGHEALGFVLAFEPEVILPHLAFSAGDRVLEHCGDAVAPAIAPFVGAGEARRLGEWLARIVFAYLRAPNAPFDLESEADARALVREFVLPATQGSRALSRKA